GITVFGYGFASGVNYEAQKLGKKYTIYTNYDAGFTDSAAGSTLANTFFSNGANIIYGCAGSVCDGIDSKAKEVKKLSNEVDANKDSNQPGYILTSVIKNTEVPVVEISKYYNEGKLSEEGGKVLTYDLGSGASGITDLSTIASKVTDKETWNKILDELNDVKAKISSGEIKVVNAQAGEKFDKSSLKNVVMPNE
ncbi:MAG: BMP family ABC transporter substrate-binding protein, partial [[Clostridium] cellulosi]